MFFFVMRVVIEERWLVRKYILSNLNFFNDLSWNFDRVFVRNDLNLMGIGENLIVWMVLWDRLSSVRNKLNVLLYFLLICRFWSLSFNYVFCFLLLLMFWEIIGG